MNLLAVNLRRPLFASLLCLLAPLTSQAAFTIADKAIVTKNLVVGNLSSAGHGTASAIGWGTIANGTYSVALGYNANTSGWGAVAIGVRASASGAGALALGRDAVASGKNSFALGTSAIATVDYAYALGFGTQATAWGAQARGNFAEAKGNHSHAIGYYAETRGTNSIAIGVQTYTNQSGETALGRYNQGASTSFVSNYGAPVLTVGNGSASGGRSNAMRIMSTGEVLIFPSGDLSMGVFTAGAKPEN